MENLGLGPLFYFILFLNPHPRIYLLILEREKERWGGKEGEREKKRNIYQLPPTGDPSRDQAFNIFGAWDDVPNN